MLSRHRATLKLLSLSILLCPLFGVAQADKSCTAAEYHQLDFWLGDWDVFEIDSGTKDAHVRVERLLDGCALHEIYDDTAGLRGESFSTYDSSRKVWHQTWVTNRGQLLIIEGGLHDATMLLKGSYKGAEGATTQVRATWKPEKDAVRETAMKSTDGGKTWKPWFDLMFRPRPSVGHAADEEAVAELDSQYQRAVKRNDADTMVKILADDFILVTGKGKTYTRSNLLEEARSGRVVYEHQEDTERTVRIWGDTAVVTAKLREKGTDSDKAFDYTLWFSDTYVRTPSGWHYVFGQASSPLAGTP